MSKYIIKVIKIQEPTDGQLMSGKRIINYAHDTQPLFESQMSSDATIEILNHLYQIKER